MFPCLFACSGNVMRSTVPPWGDKVPKPLTNSMKLMNMNEDLFPTLKVFKLAHPNHLTSWLWTAEYSRPIINLSLCDFYITTLVESSCQPVYWTYRTPTWICSGLACLNGQQWVGQWWWMGGQWRDGQQGQWVGISRWMILCITLYLILLILDILWGICFFKVGGLESQLSAVSFRYREAWPALLPMPHLHLICCMPIVPEHL